MIFFFSATGNSEHIARRIAEKTGDKAVSIVGAYRDGIDTFHLEDGEALGFVFPVYAFSMPTIVANFIKQLGKCKSGDRYVFAVFTCGANSGSTYYDLQKILRRGNMGLRFARDIVMPDNYLIMFNTPPKETQAVMLAAADEVADLAAEAVKNRREEVIFSTKNAPRIFSRLFSAFFNKYALSTKKFHADDACDACGLCAEVCPVQAITIAGGEPKWRKSRCEKCMACINRCPAAAIQYGKSTRGRARYTHPIYAKGAALQPDIRD